MKKFLLAGLIGASLLSSAALTQAVTIYGLTTANALVRFDSATPGAVLTVGTITGFTGSLVDIDFYPVNGLLYAFNTTGVMYTLNLNTGAATQVVTPGTALEGTVTATDFNPMADRLRVFTTGTTNQTYRVTPNVETNNTTNFTPGLVTADGAFNGPALPVNLVGAAYTNPVDGATTTTLYSIDTTSDRLIIHSTAGTFNTVSAVGALGVPVGTTTVGFDIGQNGIAYLTDGPTLYTVNLTTGAATLVGTVAAPTLKTIAVLVPEPSTALLAGFGFVGAMARRRRVAA